MTDVAATPLDEFLAEGVEIPNEEDAPEGWHLDNDADATRILRKLAVLQAEAKRLKDDADDEIDRVRRWLDQATGTLDNERIRLEGVLIDYHRRLRADGKAGKTYKLPAGTLKATKEQDDVLFPIANEEGAAFVEHLLNAGRFDLLRVTPSRSAIKDAVLKAGESIPGVQPVRAEDDIDTNRYSVQVSS